ncbi:MAG: hypothetical protein R3B60_02940 [Candidatus Paceibacterota bacterium]
MKKILILILLIIVTGLIFVTFSKNKELDSDPNKNEPEKVTEPPEKTIDLSNVEKPASFANVPMTTYKSADYGYEITYPESWDTVLTPKEVTNGPDLENYVIYPIYIMYGPSPILDITYYEDKVNNYIDRKVGIFDITKISLNGLDGYKYTSGTEKNHTKTTFVLTVNNEHILTITYWPNEEYNTTEEEALWVLSTLKLTDN